MFKRFAVMAVAAAALPLLSASPASAGELGTGAGANQTCSGAHCVAVSISLNVQPSDLGLDVVEFHCQVVGVADPASTGVDSCSVAGVSALLVPSNLPGAYDAAAGTALLPSGSDVQVCATGHSDFVESTAGAPTVRAGGCTQDVVISIGS